jgi:hypothetical protein
MSSRQITIDLIWIFNIVFLSYRCKKGKCNMQRAAHTKTLSQLEGSILLEIEAIATQIRDLLHQKHSLEQVLIRARQQDELVRRTDVTRKNSINRVLVEGAIRNSFKGLDESVAARTLYLNARLMVPSLQESTFRSYLFRMQKRGLLTPYGYGKWLLGTKQQALNSPVNVHPQA